MNDPQDNTLSNSGPTEDDVPTGPNGETAQDVVDAGNRPELPKRGHDVTALVRVTMHDVGLDDRPGLDEITDSIEDALGEDLGFDVRATAEWVDR